MNSLVLTTTQTVAPAVEPLLTADVKEHGRIDTSAEDSLIEDIIEAARGAVENYLGRTLISATYTTTYKDFPGKYGRIYLPEYPVTSVTSVTYTDTAGDTQTLSTDIYRIVKGNVYAYLTPKYNQYWPDTQLAPHTELVTVTYVAGYANAAAVPSAIRTALKMLCLDLYENRQASGEARLTANPTYKMLLDPHRVPGVA